LLEKQLLWENCWWKYCIYKWGYFPYLFQWQC